MPKFPKSLEPKRPQQVKANPPPSREALLRSALASLLRKLGKVGHLVPADLALIALARDFTEGGRGVADDQGKTWDIADYLAPPNPLLDENIPF
jgi:hypothetical protein